MGWARFDDNYTDHPKVRDLSIFAEMLDMRAIIYCARYETDGLVTPSRLKMFSHQVTKISERIDELVVAGRWKTNAGGGWLVHDYLAFNPSKAQKDDQRARGRERVAKHRLSTGGNAVTNAYQSRGGESLSLKPKEQRVRSIARCSTCGQLDVDCQCPKTATGETS